MVWHGTTTVTGGTRATKRSYKSAEWCTKETVRRRTTGKSKRIVCQTGKVGYLYYGVLCFLADHLGA